MKVREIVSHLPFKSKKLNLKGILEYHDRFEYSMHHDHENRDKPSTNYVLVDKNGKAVRTGLSKEAAEALRSRPDLIKKYGPLRVRS
jgi:hypothetical protein